MDKKILSAIIAAKEASRELNQVNRQRKNKFLSFLAQNLLSRRKTILAANLKDLKFFSSNHPLYDRLLLTRERIKEMSESVLAVKRLPDPIGEVIYRYRAKNGLSIQQVRTPLGLIGVIYEARPNVTVEIVSLALKTGNSLVLKGGKEAKFSNQALVKVIKGSLKQAGLPETCVILLDPTNKALVRELLHLNYYLDVIIPRGGKALIDFIRENSTVPIIETGAGVCHTYVEASAKLKPAAEIVFNAKTQRPSVCNALDTLVVDQKILKTFLPLVAKRLAKKKVEIFADQKSYAVMKLIYPPRLLKRASVSDFGREFLSLKMSIKTVKDSNEAIEFIQKHSSGHSEAIITQNKRLAEKFLKLIDAAAVYHNASTRFTDGFQFGLGAEVGISTQKLHARGPMGLKALTSYKWVVRGQGQVRR